jgi:prepilin-type N-terminal cleavage/methylation domain-containing protein
MGHREPGPQLASGRLPTASARGFTFVEVMVSLALLAASVSILIGMEGAAVRRTLRDMNEQQAILTARRIMAALETEDRSNLTMNSDANVPVTELLERFNLTSPADQENKDTLARMRASLAIQEQQIQLRPDQIQVMILIQLTIAWSTSPYDQTIVSLLRP